MSTAKPADIAAIYFNAWKANDFARLRSILAPDVDFVGPLGKAHGAEECAQGMQKLSEIKTDIVIDKMVADGDDVITWFQLHTKVAPPIPVANWSHIENGKVSRIRVTFDARPLTSPPPRS